MFIPVSKTYSVLNWERRTSTDINLTLPANTTGIIVPLESLADSDMNGAFTYASDRWTIVTPGSYYFSGKIAFFSTGARPTPIVEVRVNGVSVHSVKAVYIRNSGFTLDYQDAPIPYYPLTLKADDYIEVWAGRGAGASQTFSASGVTADLVPPDSYMALGKM